MLIRYYNRSILLGCVMIMFGKFRGFVMIVFGRFRGYVMIMIGRFRIRRPYLCFIGTSIFLIIIGYGKDIYNLFVFTYPLQNAKDIVNEIELIGSSPVPVINSYSGSVRFQKTASSEHRFSKNSGDNLLIAVKSYVGNFDQRLAIRQTWGNKLKNINVVFLVGTQNYTDSMLQYENELYHDLIQGSFIDTYDSNIFKTLMAYQWIVKYCENARSVFLVDDDYFVNIEGILDFIAQQKNFEYLDRMYGYRLDWASPIRWQDSKWFVPKSEYQYLFWPPYLIGGAILTNIHVVKKLYKAFPYVKHVHIDDVYIGIVAKLLGVTLMHDQRFSCNHIPPREMGRYFASHLYGERGLLINGWRQFNTFKNLTSLL